MMKSANEEYFNAAVELVDKNVERGFGQKTAIYYLDEQITYEQVWQEVNKLGNGLLSLGIQMENRVLLLLLDSPQFVYSFFGAMKIGAVPIPTNTLLKSADYLYLLNDSRAKVAIVSQELIHLIEPIKEQAKYLQQLIVVGEAGAGQISYHDLVSGQSLALTPAETCQDDPAFWLYSSGTTGFPKGAVHLHHDMIFAAETYGKEILGTKPEDTTYSVAKLFFAYGLGNALYFPFHVGASTVLSPLPPLPETVLHNVKKYRPTLFFSVPTSYSAMLQVVGQEDNWGFDGVRMCVSAGEALPEAIFYRWRDRFGLGIVDGIGSTEILHIFISNVPGKIVPGSTGKIVPGYNARIVDEEGRVMPNGEVGMLHVKGDSIAAYYWNKHEKTKETFLGDWINTGDRFYQDEAGYFWYVGRGDDMIKAGGIWVSPVEVENALMKHNSVLECGVIGKADRDNLVKPKAFVVLKKGCQPSVELAEELKQFVKGQIAHYKYPRWVEFVEELPKTATGKIQRYKLRELEQSKDAS
jgi:benzoate-CoA ligase